MLVSQSFAPEMAFSAITTEDVSMTRVSPASAESLAGAATVQTTDAGVCGNDSGLHGCAEAALASSHPVTVRNALVTA
jgi:hypothetical protein